MLFGNSFKSDVKDQARFFSVLQRALGKLIV